MLDPRQRCAVFIDIDSTLIARDFKVPQRNLEAIARARQAGHAVFINTGRSWSNIPKMLRDQLEIDGYVAGNGAYLRLGEQELFRASFPQGAMKAAAEFIFRDRDHWLVFEGYLRNYSIGNGLRQPNEWQIPVESAEEFLALSAGDEIQVLAIGPTVPEEFLSLLEDDMTVLPMGHYADCAVKGRSKAIGLLEMLDAIGVSRENSIAIGDSGNDLEMLQCVGVGVAVGNADPAVKAHASLITASNVESGVAVAIEQLLFGGNQI
ncbi:MAG: HAD family phosphatase [Clostridia bacterium]|nr:HAD family phosphatase [Clostridia bacterium]